MIRLTGINHKEFFLNADHIEKLEMVPESLITLVNGKKYYVLETVEEVIGRVVEYKRSIFKFGLQ